MTAVPSDAAKKVRRSLSKDVSSILISTPALVIWLAGGIITLAIGQIYICSFFLLLLAIGILARLWSHSALYHVESEIDADSATIFAGDMVEITYSITNRKILPLVWLEFVQYLPSSGCMEPADAAEIRRAQIPAREADARMDEYRRKVQEAKDHPTDPPTEVERPDLTRPAYTKRFAFVLWHQQMHWQATWRALHRGIYPINHVLLQSGDGFGLSQVEAVTPVKLPPTYVVYPKIVPVKSAFFLTNLWQAQQGKAGYVEDCTIIRSERDYQNGDPWKRIDWRVAARGGGLQVKLYETIQPRMVHFLLDAASLLQKDAGVLEEAISLVASLIVKLESSGNHCGLSLPATDLQDEINLYPNEQTTKDSLLFCLARFEWAEEIHPLSPDNLAGSREQMGQGYLVTYRAQEHSVLSLLESLGGLGLTVLSWENSGPVGNLRVCCLQDLKGADRHG